MKVVFWNECYISGGADWSLIDLIESWPVKSDEMEVWVNETHEGLDLIRSKTKNKAQVKTYKSFMEIGQKLKKNALLGFLAKKGGVFGKLLIWALAAPLALATTFFCIKKNSGDVLIINNGGYPGGLSNYIAAFWAKLKNIRCRYMIVRNYPITSYEKSPKMKFYKYLAQFVIVKIVAVSDSLKNDLVKKSGLPAKIFERIYNGISVENKMGNSTSSFLNKFSDISFKVGIIGNFEKRKGHDVLFKAWAKVLRKNANAKLFIFGSRTSGDVLALEQLAQTLNIDQSLIWHDFMPDIGQAYKALDIVVMPSTSYESFGRIVVEAMAFGRPIVASRVGGIPELIKDGVDGLLFDKSDDKKLGDILMELMDSKKLRQKLSDNGLVKYRNNFTSIVMASNYYNFVKKGQMSIYKGDLYETTR